MWIDLDEKRKIAILEQVRNQIGLPAFAVENTVFDILISHWDMDTTGLRENFKFSSFVIYKTHTGSCLAFDNM